MMTHEPTLTSQEAPIKLMVKDLREVSVNKASATFPFKMRVSSRNAMAPTDIQFSQVWLQGSVKSGCDSETFVLNDGSGNVRVEKCSRVPGDKSWIKPGLSF